MKLYEPYKCSLGFMSVWERVEYSGKHPTAVSAPDILYDKAPHAECVESAPARAYGNSVIFKLSGL